VGHRRVVVEDDLLDPEPSGLQEPRPFMLVIVEEHKRSLVLGDDAFQLGAGKLLTLVMGARRAISLAELFLVYELLEVKYGVEAVDLGVRGGLLDNPCAEAFPNADLEDDGRLDLFDEPVQRKGTAAPESLHVVKGARSHDGAEL